jgi:hypothetical protein
MGRFFARRCATWPARVQEMITQRVAKMTPHLLKIVVCVAGLAFVAAVPADAKKARKDRKPVAARTVVTAQPYYRGTHLFPAGPIYFGQDYLGDDPDPFIRSQILRDVGVRYDNE